LHARNDDHRQLKLIWYAVVDDFAMVQLAWSSSDLHIYSLMLYSDSISIAVIH